ncbi:protein of unknown function [Candidatus Methylocalor cossyra]|uniref:Uncharacterized protein n=1 Tax=Candidatus Methylocalor cossyra TaxID=3108543 RepID=A0ABM9NKR9_9GAMM
MAQRTLTPKTWTRTGRVQRYLNDPAGDWLRTRVVARGPSGPET